MNVKEIVPGQEKGGQVDVERSVTPPSLRRARRIFELAASRLLNVNEWDKICGPISAKFTLTDSNGIPVMRKARAGDYFKIDIHVPGTVEGDGFDWVRIETIEDDRDPTGPIEQMAIRVRPAANPTSNSNQVAHFFDEDATSTFMITRHHNGVVAAVHGRNEVANTNVNAAADKIRNAVVATGAKAGTASVQWQALVDGLLKAESE